MAVMERLTVSVVMPTYNGSKNIVEQLESIRKQTYVPDEVLVFDDGSKDGTVEIVQDFIDRFSLNGWSVHKNSKNLGWRENFFQAIYAASSELIFTSDQDDIWYDTKIEKMVSFFANQQKANVLISDYDELIEEGGVSYPVTERKIGNVSEDGKVNFDKNNLYLNRPGWVYAIRKSFMTEIKIYQENAIVPVHDIAMWSTAVLTDSLYYLSERTGQWRKHGNSAIRKENEIDDQKIQQQIRLDKLQRRWEVTVSDIKYLKQSEYPFENQKAKFAVMNQLTKEFSIRKEIILENSLVRLIRELKSYTAIHPILADVRFMVMNKFR